MNAFIILFNSLFEMMGLATFDTAATVVDGYSGATPLALAYQGGWENVTEHFTVAQMFWGTIPGSIGETNSTLTSAAGKATPSRTKSPISRTIPPAIGT